jgi:hypothetical protein
MFQAFEVRVFLSHVYLRPFFHWSNTTVIQSRKKLTTIHSWQVVIASWWRWWKKHHYELKVRPVGDCKVFFFLDWITVASTQWENSLTVHKSAEQCTCIKFVYQTGKMAPSVYEFMEVAFGDAKVSWAQVFTWFCYFKEGRMPIESDRLPGHLSANRNNDLQGDPVNCYPPIQLWFCSMAVDPLLTSLPKY